MKYINKNFPPRNGVRDKQLLTPNRWAYVSTLRHTPPCVTTCLVTGRQDNAQRVRYDLGQPHCSENEYVNKKEKERKRTTGGIERWKK